MFRHYRNSLHFLDTLKLYALKRVEEPLNQLIEGLQKCGIYKQMKAYPHLFKDVFCDDKRIVTSEVFEKIFDIEYSEAGFNRREIENMAISYFRDYILDCEGKAYNSFFDFIPLTEYTFFRKFCRCK